MKKKYRRIYLEITNICNLSCSFCPITERQKHYMRLSDFEAAIKQVSPLTEQVCLHLMGEPLAHPNIDEILKLCEKYGAKIQLTTNGLLLKKHQQLLMETSCLHQVNISVQSYMDNFPEKNISDYLERIYSFIELALLENPDLYMNLRLWNISEHPHEANDIVFDFLERKLSISINRNIELGRIKSKKLKGRLYLHFDSRFEWPRIDQPYKSTKGRCNGLIDHFAVHADGSVVPCCLDDQKVIKLGNLFEESIVDILEGERAKNIEQGFRDNKLVEDLCQRCTYINRFSK